MRQPSADAFPFPLAFVRLDFLAHDSQNLADFHFYWF